MNKDEFLRLISSGKSIIINVLGQTFGIIASEGICIMDYYSCREYTYRTAQELIDDFRVDRLTLRELTPWIRVNAVYA